MEDQIVKYEWAFPDYAEVKDLDFEAKRHSTKYVKWFVPAFPDHNNERNCNAKGPFHTKENLLNGEHRCSKTFSDQASSGGLSRSVLSTVLFRGGKAQRLPSPDDPDLELVWNALKLEVNIGNSTSTFFIETEKNISR